MELYDVIIIGGGPTGSTSATNLVQKGLKVLVLEKESFPREHVGESLIPLSYKSLEKQGLIDDLKKISTRKPGVNFVDRDGKYQSLWCFKNVIKDKSYLTFHVVRSAFDKLLLDNSRKRGAEVMEQTTVKNVILDKPDGIVEVDAVDANGKALKFHSKFIIDASGQSTFLARKLGVKKSYEGLDRVATWSHWTNTTFDKPLREGVIKIVYLGGDKKGWMWIIPISKDHLSIGVVINNSYVKEQKQKLQKTDDAHPDDWKEKFYLQEIADSYVRESILKDAVLSHKAQMIGDYSYYCDEKYGSNYALLGDAGAFLDPIFSSGIYVGMHSAELASEAIYQKITKGNADEEFKAVFAQITGALKLLEKFIRLFYTPEAFNFATAGRPEDLAQYDKFESAYTIFHYLLAGDFFKNYEKYSEFIDMVRDQKTLGKFQNLINHKKDIAEDSTCDESFEEMYGEMTHKVEFNNEQFM
ncbi:MAG: dependent oxidoreductase [Bacteroidetes bacterium]|nr:dependent oxidoreductase [Bacteroidota bacterium]